MRIKWLFVMVFFSVQTVAKPLLPEQVPQPLQPWIDWVLQDNESRVCPFEYNNFQQKRCAWPARLALDLANRQGEFVILWKVYAPSWVVLPGDRQVWPQRVTVNGKAATVLDRQGQPAIRLPAGDYRIHGLLLWDKLPERLGIPAEAGLLELTVNHEPVVSPFIKNGKLWLKMAKPGPETLKSLQNRLDMHIFRKIIDQVPMQVLTRLELDVSGKPREVKLASPMLDGFMPMRLSSPLPARLEEDGGLSLRLKPGHWVIEILARSPEPVDKLRFTRPGKDWPDTEIWSFDAQPQLRLVEISGLPAIDPRQNPLPKSWRHLPAYQVKPNQSMVFRLIRRGNPEPEPNQLNLQRTLWLDFDGQGYTVQDRIDGRISHGWRLDVAPEMQLGQVLMEGRSHLITQLPGSSSQGVEVRKGRLELSADSRIEGAIRDFQASGWQTGFHSASARLNLPPGWRLLAVTGVDNVPQSLIARWSLLDLFLVLIMALAVGRLWNGYWGGLALLALILIWHETQAPRLIWLNLLVAVALLRVLPEGRFLAWVKFYRNAAGIVLLVILIPFMVGQVRTAIYPQLEKPGIFTQVAQQDRWQVSQAPRDKERALARKTLSKLKAKAPVSAELLEGRMASDAAVNFARIDPKAHIQTGPGLPQWQWQGIQLSWNGPLDVQQRLSLYLLSPAWNAFLNICRIVLVVLLAALLMFDGHKQRFRWRFPGFGLALCLPLCLLKPQTVYADFPDQDILQQLRERLLAAPACLPACAQIESMQLSIDEQRIDLALRVHVQKNLALPLPGQRQQWLPNQVLLDGKPAPALYQDEGGYLWLAPGPGLHRIEMQGMTPKVSRFSMPMPLPAHYVVVRNKGWSVDGLHESGHVDGPLQFQRLLAENAEPVPQEHLQPGLLPAFVRVERTLQLGLDWRVQNHVVRVTAADTPLALQIPLLAGEAVITPGIRVDKGKVWVNMPAGQSRLSWLSTLEKKSCIVLEAPRTAQWVEVWQADISPVWHVQSGGIAVVQQPNQGGRWLPKWRPWPGERVSLDISRPAAVEGRTLTIERSELHIKPGKRVQEATLYLTLRSSQGGQHSLQLPEHAVLQSVQIDGRLQPVRQKKNRITLPIRPGKQKITLQWRTVQPLDSVLKTPTVNLGMASVNSYLQIDLAPDRWLLFTFGPALGPAVLFWGVLVVVVLLAFALARLPWVPLQAWQWLLLLLGLTQVSLLAAMAVVAWFVLLGWRAQRPLQKRACFNGLQIGLGLWTLMVFVILFAAVQQGLLGAPDMQIRGNLSSAEYLKWYQDRSGENLPVAGLVSVPLGVYRWLMLAWSLWLAFALLNWLKWGWRCFSKDRIWQKNKPAGNPLMQTGKKE